MPSCFRQSFAAAQRCGVRRATSRESSIAINRSPVHRLQSSSFSHLTRGELTFTKGCRRAATRQQGTALLLERMRARADRMGTEVPALSSRAMQTVIRHDPLTRLCSADTRNDVVAKLSARLPVNLIYSHMLCVTPLGLSEFRLVLHVLASISLPVKTDLC